ncbi:MAG: outer membrane lipoprotein carrier protein LolA [Prevotella sp.]
MKKLQFIIVLLLSVLSVSAQRMQKANGAQQAKMISVINATAASIKTIESNFTQVKSVSFLNEKVKSYGRMYYSNQGKLRWEYVSPYKYTFAINGGKVYIKSGAKSQVIDIRTSRLFNSIAQIMINSITGKSLKANGDFNTQMYVNGNEWIAVLTPKKAQMKKMFRTVQLHFNSHHSMVSEVVMTETSGDSTVITLSGVKTNENIPDQIFFVK